MVVSPGDPTTAAPHGLRGAGAAAVAAAGGGGWAARAAAAPAAAAVRPAARARTLTRRLRDVISGILGSAFKKSLLWLLNACG